MQSYFYKAIAPSVLAAVTSWTERKAAWNASRIALGKVFGGEASPMFSGSRNYVGGVKIGDGRDLDVHWCRPDQHGYRSLRRSAKFAKGTSKDDRAVQAAEHERLSALWKEHCPPSICMDDAWEAIGLNSGALWMCGGVFFELGGVVYLNLGLQLQEDGEHILGATEILASEYEAARHQVLEQRKAA